MQGINITDFILHVRQRPDTKWKSVLVTNVRFTLYQLNYPSETVTVHLPDYVKKSKTISSLNKNSKGKFYKDHLCAFRCIATHQVINMIGWKCILYRYSPSGWSTCKTNVLMPVLVCARKHSKALNCHNYFFLKKCFKINVNIFRIQEDQFALPVYKSHCHFKDTMHLNLFDNHLSYIANLNAYTQKYQCPSCDMHFRNAKI